MERTRLQRQVLVTARETLPRAAAGQDGLDFVTAASMIDRVLATTCEHNSSEHHTALDAKSGRPLTIRYARGVSWYADYKERLRT